MGLRNIVQLFGFTSVPVPKTLFNVAPSELNVAEGITALREFLLLRYFWANEKNMRKILLV